MQKALNPEPLQLSFRFDAYELLTSPQFHASTSAVERNCLTTEYWPLLEAFGLAFGPHDAYQSQYDTFFNACIVRDGYVKPNPILDHFVNENDEREEAFWALTDRLNNALTAEVVCCIAEALQLVGVTDPTTVCEVCRCVIRGGNLWDGKGFSPGQVPAGVVLEAPASAPVLEASNACPHCGVPNESGASRCFSCERQIG